MRNLFFIIFIFPIFLNAQSIVVGDTVSAGVIYKNIPDTTLPFVAKATSICDIDIDNDNVNDIRFSHEHGSSPCFISVLKRVTALTALEFVLTSSNIYADTLATDSVINKNLNWKNVITGNYLRYAYTQFCPPPASSSNGAFIQKNNYLGFRKITALDTIYGWFLLDMTGTIKIKSFAYQTNNPIGIGIKENSKLFVLKPYPNPVSDKVEFVLSNSSSDLEIRLYNSFGQIVIEEKKANSNKFTLDVSNYANGLYYVEVESKEGISRAKFVKN